MIRHTVVFSAEACQGLAGRKPASRRRQAHPLAIPGVDTFEQFRQVSAKNNYAFGFSMEFADQAAYDGYNDHPAHVAFVRDRWLPEVSDFLEIDYVRI